MERREFVALIGSATDDPVRLGLAASLAKPGGHLTGVAILVADLTAKRLELLPPGTRSVRVAILSNPSNPPGEGVLRELEGAANSMRLQFQIFRASTSEEIDAVFATIAVAGCYVRLRRALFSQSARLHWLFGSVPSDPRGRCAEVGGLMSYGASLRDAYRQVGA